MTMLKVWKSLSRSLWIGHLSEARGDSLRRDVAKVTVNGDVKFVYNLKKLVYNGYHTRSNQK